MFPTLSSFFVLNFKQREGAFRFDRLVYCQIGANDSSRHEIHVFDLLKLLEVNMVKVSKKNVYSSPVLNETANQIVRCWWAISLWKKLAKTTCIPKKMQKHDCNKTNRCRSCYMHRVALDVITWTVMYAHRKIKWISIASCIYLNKVYLDFIGI